MKSSPVLHIVYLSMDGMTEPLGQSQVLSYLKRISNSNIHFTIISFEKPELFEIRKSEIEAICDSNKIVWAPLKYRSFPPILGIIFGLVLAWFSMVRLNRRKKIDIIHCRGNITPLLGLLAKWYWKVPFIFDMRGWGADEKFESGHWRKWYYMPVYHYFKRMEERFFKESDKIVSLTFAGKKEIVVRQFAKAEKVGVIPTCVDFNIFKEYNLAIRREIRNTLSIPENNKVFLYSGSLGGNYPIQDILFFYSCYLKLFPDAYFIILCKNSGIDLGPHIVKLGLPKNQIVVKSVHLPEVSSYIQCADLGLIYYEKTFSVIGRSPTKLGEYWASGIPAISMSKIGDLDYISSLFPDNLKLVNNLTEEEIVAAFREMENFSKTKEKLRMDAESYFGIEKGVEFYTNIYNELLS